jgi:Tfp pilus assembly ATPase PilU
MSGYSIPDLLQLLQTERGDRVLLQVGSPPTLILKGELHAIEGPPVSEESAEEMIGSIASTREMRAFRESGTVDVITTVDGSSFLVRAIRAVGVFRLELLPVAV